MTTKELLTDKERVSDLFSKLRKAGIVAKQNFRCCSTCAGYELAANSAPLTPIVFYHAQDAEVWTRRLMLGSVPMHDLGGDRTLYLRWGYTERAESGTVATEKQATELGRFIARIAHDCKLGVLWNGTPERCIGLTAFEEDEFFTQTEELPAETIAAIAIDPTK
jgi:hypothetical protein